jgi:hypothetical protein
MAWHVHDFDGEVAERKALAVANRRSNSLPSPFKSVALNTGLKIFCTSRMCSPIPTLAPVLSLM